MSPNVFLAPCDVDGFERTVLSPVDLGDRPDHPSALDGMDAVRLWGAREGSGIRGYFEKMAPGDLVLFYRDDAYVGTGRVGLTFEDDANWASTTFWEGEPVPLVYTIESFTPVSVPASAVNEIFDYAETYTPSGLMRVAERRVRNSAAAIELALARYSERHA